MSGSTRLDVAALAASGVLTADELMKAVQSSHDRRDGASKKHLTHAAIAAAVAIGAFELLRRDEKKEQMDGAFEKVTEIDEEASEFEGDRYRHQHESSHHSLHSQDHSPRGHKRRLLEEIGGAYALGEEMIGHKKHHVAHLVSFHRLHGLTFTMRYDVGLCCLLYPHRLTSIEGS
jgi:hypothetical protein